MGDPEFRECFLDLTIEIYRQLELLALHFSRSLSLIQRETRWLA